MIVLIYRYILMQVPSLMSLGNNYSGPGPNYPNQQNFSSGRFSDRPARHPIKNQRPQPYNKVSDFMQYATLL